MNFIVYTKDNCPYCTKIKYVLERLEVQHQVYKLDVDFDREEFYEKFGIGSTFPQIIVDGNSQKEFFFVRSLTICSFA